MPNDPLRAAVGLENPEQDIGLSRSPMGDTPGVLDPYLLDNPFAQGLNTVGHYLRFGMSPGEKWQHTMKLGPERGSPSTAQMDEAQRQMSVMAGSNMWGPIPPTILSLLAIDNPAILHSGTAEATKKALEAYRSGEGAPFFGSEAYQPGPIGQVEADLALWLLSKLGKQRK